MSSEIIGITIGDPKGIGPEVISAALRKIEENLHPLIRIYGDTEILESKFKPKLNDADAAKIALRALDDAVSDAVKGKIGAIVTAPVNKSRMRLIVTDFTGHTEYLAKKTGALDPTMMFILNSMDRKPLFVSLVTRHAALRDVPSSVTKMAIEKTAKHTHEAARVFLKRENVQLAVLSLNPHSGDKGAFGNEEAEIIEPAIAAIRETGIDAAGPFAADGLFGSGNYRDFDAVIAMYHDQAMIPVKILGMKDSVNVTLGLPFIRTSPPHGTAEDIAWQMKADFHPMLAAIRVAARMVIEKR